MQELGGTPVEAACATAEPAVVREVRTLCTLLHPGNPQSFAPYGLTDLQLDTSTEITRFNKEIYQSMHNRKNVSLIILKILYFSEIYF
jgi:hypothetical protein